MHIGLYGGTFNPIHMGHLRTVLEVYEQFNLDKIVFIPSAIPPHKVIKSVVDAEERIKMVQLALHSTEQFEVSDVELQRLGPSYTVDTVSYFQSLSSVHIKYYLIIGLDAFLDVHTWYEYERLFKLIPLIIMIRPRFQPHTDLLPTDVIYQYLKKHIDDKYTCSTSLKGFFHFEKVSVFMASVTQLDISSTQIRNALKMGRSVKYLLPKSVEQYIIKKGLYS